MYASGIGYREIERLTGVNHNTIIYWARQAKGISIAGEPEGAESSTELDEPDST